MRHNWVCSDVNDALPELMEALLTEGAEVTSRAGLTKELMHVGITLGSPLRREVILPERRASIAAQIVETMWVLSGRNDIAALSPYLPRAADFSDDGTTWRAGYGPRLRNAAGVVDQLAYVVDTLKKSPGSRQAVATLWDPEFDTEMGKDIACNNWLSFSCRLGKVDLHVGVRSNDAMWGWSGINVFEWSVLLELVARLTGQGVGSLHFSTTSFHLYDRHWAKAERIAGGLYTNANDSLWFAESPRLGSDISSLSDWDLACDLFWGFEEKIRTGADVNVDEFGDPMLESWLRVLQWYWSGDRSFLFPLAGTMLHEACRVGAKPTLRSVVGSADAVTKAYDNLDIARQAVELVERAEDLDARIDELHGPGAAAAIDKAYADGSIFGGPQVPLITNMLGYLNTLHAEKHAAYGPSWKARGEAGILNNIARKVDRIATGQDTDDESQRDTAIDLVVYLAKYRLWLDDNDTAADPAQVAALLATASTWSPRVAKNFSSQLSDIEHAQLVEYKISRVEGMLGDALTHALALWR